MAKKKNSKKDVDEKSEAHSDNGSGTASANEDVEGVCTCSYLNECVEQLSSARPEIRKKHLLLIQQYLRVNYPAFPDDWNYKETLMFNIESCLKKDKVIELVEALRLLSIYATQVSLIEVQEVEERFHEFLESRICDSTKAGELRAACATTAAWLNYISLPKGHPYLKTLMEKLANVFKCACLKGNGMAPDFPKSQVDLHKDSLYAWGLVFNALHPIDAAAIGKDIISDLVSVLQSKYLEVRVAACDVLGIVYERIREETKEDFKGPYFDNLMQVLDSLVNDSNKHTSKVDLKKQRSYFRDLIRFLRSHEAPIMEVKLSRESLELETYKNLFLYQAFCHLLTLGTKTHLLENMLLRNIFELGPPVQPVQQSLKVRNADKKIRHLENQRITKERTLEKAKSREKRSFMKNDEF